MIKFILALALVVIAPTKLGHAQDTEFDCLTRNIYYEAAGEPYKGKLAVALVTLNRADSPKFPKKICDVVYQKHQFSWTRKYSKIKYNKKAWQDSKNAAFEAYLNRDILGKFKATHYHNFTVKPKWGLKKLTVINNHIFYM